MPKLTFHLIPHTHWDREWYLARGQFGARLLPVVDDLIALLQENPAIRGVLLDGQTVLLEDYLRARPEQLDRVRELVAAGRIETGPWYVLADEQIPSAESLVRNLLLGTADAELWGRSMNVLYSPDAFGHPAILPQLAHEFRIDSAVAWRGIARGQATDLYRWRGPDGSEVLLCHLPPHGYESGSDLRPDAEELPEAWASLRSVLTGRARCEHIAVFIGADHHAIPPYLVALRERLAELEPGNDVRLSSLEDYCRAVVAQKDLPLLFGEQREYGYTWTLQGVHSTRAHQKRRNSQLELWLERFAEPMAALAEVTGGRNRRPLLKWAWRSLVQCHFHDTIGGCASDDVARGAEVRFHEVEGVVREITRASGQDLWGHDPDRAREEPDAIRPAMVVWNPAARPRSGVVLAELTVFRKDVLVGPPGSRTPRSGRDPFPTALLGPDGTEIPFQVLEVVPALERLDAKAHYPDQDEVDLMRVAFESPRLPGMSGLALTPTGSVSVSEDKTEGGRSIENALVRVNLGTNGSLTLTNRLSGREYRGVMALEHEADIGDTYTFCPPELPGPALTAGRAKIRQVTRGPLVSQLEASWSLTSASERRRAADHRIDIGLSLMLVAGEGLVRCTLQLTNRGKDQRIRARFPTAIAGVSALAGAQFGAITRSAARSGSADHADERPTLTAPAHRFVAAADTHGLGLFCPGFFEYELTPEGDLLLTLLRSVGQLSRSDLVTRPGHAGWPTATPLAQCPGSHRISFAIAPLAGRVCRDGAMLHRLWEDAFVPVRGTWLRDYVPSSSIPATAASIQLEGDGLVFSALKPAERAAGLVLRCYNIREQPVEGAWRLGFAVSRAGLCRADELVTEDLPLHDEGRTVRFTVPGRGIGTVLLSPATVSPAAGS